MRSLSFQNRLTLIFLLISTILIGITLFSVNLFVRSQVEEKVESDFRRTFLAFQNQIKERVSSFENLISSAVRDPLFRGQLGSLQVGNDELGLGSSSASIQSVHRAFASAQIPLFSRYPMLAVADSEGTLVYSKQNQKQFGRRLTTQLIETSLRTGRGIALWWSNDSTLQKEGLFDGINDGRELYFVLSQVVSTGGVPLGIVIVGEPVNDGLLPSLEKISQSNIVLQTPDRQLASTVQSESVRQAISEKQNREFKIKKERYLLESAPIKPYANINSIGNSFLARSLDKELGSLYRKLGITFLIAMSLAVIIGIPVTSLVSRQITIPIRRLESAAKRIQQGKLDTVVNVRGGDEIGRLGEAFNEMTEGLKQRDQIKSTFKHYLAPQIVDELIKNPEKVELGGEKRKVSVIFSDIEGFTSLSENRDASETVNLLNEYFDLVGHAFVELGGILDKFSGDSIMCFFGAPFDEPLQAQKAVSAALRNQQICNELQKNWIERGLPRLRCRIGINMGTVVAGNLGSTLGQDYTVIGDAVNLASRLEGVNKVYGTTIIVSSSIREACPDEFLFRKLDLVQVKGKKEITEIYEVIASKDQAAPSQRELVFQFEEAFKLYQQREWKKAQKAFLKCLELDGGDSPSRMMMNRCKLFASSPPNTQWNGSQILNSKTTVEPDFG